MEHLDAWKRGYAAGLEAGWKQAEAKAKASPNTAPDFILVVKPLSNCITRHGLDYCNKPCPADGQQMCNDCRRRFRIPLSSAPIQPTPKPRLVCEAELDPIELAQTQAYEDYLNQDDGL